MGIVKPGDNRKKGPKTIFGARGETVLTIGDLEGEEADRALRVIETQESKIIMAAQSGRVDFARLWVYDLVFNAGTLKEKHVLGVTFNGVKKLYKKEHPKGYRLLPLDPGVPKVTEWEQAEERKEFENDASGKARFKGVVTVTVPYFRAGVILQDIETGGETAGTFDQERWRTFQLRNGIPQAEFNPHARQIALSKAIRKAMQETIDPEVYFSKMYDWFRLRKHVAQINDFGEVKQIGQAQGGDPKTVLRRTMFAIANTAGLDCDRNEKDRDALLKYVERKMGKPTTAATMEEMQRAKAHLDGLLAEGKEKFVAAVRGA